MKRDTKKPVHRLLGVLCTGAVCCILGACSERPDEDGFSIPDGQMDRISLQPGITTMATVTPPLAGKLITKSEFQQGDKVGFFSMGGYIRDGESKDFLNLPLVLSGTTFNSETLSDPALADPGRMERIFSYYPYMEGMEKPEGVDIYAKGTGSEVCDKDGHELPLRVIDFLATRESKNGEYLNTVNEFFHSFSIVRVQLGDGFKDFEGDIYLQLERKVKGMWIDMEMDEKEPSLYHDMVVGSNITGGLVQLVYDDDAVSAKSRRLKTFPCESTGDNKCWDAIVPCRPIFWWDSENANAGGVTVQSIILDPKDDNQQDIEIPVDNYKIFVQVVGNQMHGLRGGYIYKVIVKKEGFEASVFPVDVQEWTTKNITENIPVGIKDAGQYKNFVFKYNECFSEGIEYSTEQIAEKAQALTEWGSTVDGTFTVFLLDDIDLSKDTGMENLIINNLVIPIDGRGKTIRNCRVNRSFCRTMTGGGALKNLRFDNLRVVPEAAGDNTPVGLLVETMENGTIEGCQVTGGWIEGGTSETKLGAAVGTMNGGSVTNCSFRGFMYGEENPEHDGLVGVYEKGTVDNKNNQNNMTVLKR